MADLKEVLDAVQKNKQALTEQIASRVKELQERRKELQALADTVALKAAIENLKAGMDNAIAWVRSQSAPGKGKPDSYRDNFVSNADKSKPDYRDNSGVNS